jgi:hypothetical protein
MCTVAAVLEVSPHAQPYVSLAAVGRFRFLVADGKSIQTGGGDIDAEVSLR